MIVSFPNELPAETSESQPYGGGITLSSNASRVPFEYSQYYLNKKGKGRKARVNEWTINQV